jgi:hypothetical protein
MYASVARLFKPQSRRGTPKDAALVSRLSVPVSLVFSSSSICCRSILQLAFERPKCDEHHTQQATMFASMIDTTKVTIV